MYYSFLILINIHIIYNLLLKNFITSIFAYRKITTSEKNRPISTAAKIINGIPKRPYPIESHCPKGVTGVAFPYPVVV